MKRVVEPVRKSMLDVIKKNLRAAGKTVYITRIVYIGEYFGTHSNIEEKVESVIRSLQEDYTNVSICGMLLVYPQYFIHVLQAPEDIIYRHFKALYDKNDDYEILRTVLLPTYHHVHQTFFTEWFHVYVIPPSLLQKIESYEIEDIQLQMSNCFNKIYSLCDHISNTDRDYSVPMSEVVRNLSDKIARLCPESTLLEYLLNVKSPVLQTAEEYLQICSSVPFINFYSDTIWPPPRDLMFCSEFDKEDRKNDDSGKHRRATRQSQKIDRLN